MLTGERLSGRVWFVVCVVLCWFMTGCSSKSTPPGGFQFVTPTSSPTLDLGESLNMTVSQSASWSLASGCGNIRPAGTFTGGTLTATGTSATYVAPATINAGACQQDVVTATASSNSAALAVFLAAPLSGIQNSSLFTYGGQGCAQEVTTCCPAPGTVLVPLPANPNASPAVVQVGVFSNVGGGTAKLRVTGGVAPYTWKVSTGSLPPGMTLTPGNDTSQLAITGTPTAPGCSTFGIVVSDSTAPANCDPSQTNAPCATTTLNVVVVPPSLKVQVPAYTTSLNDPLNGDQGVPYPQTALSVSGGQGPFFWCQNPPEVIGPDTLPPGLKLNSIQQPNFDCSPTDGPSILSTTGSVVISGTPNPGDELSQNACNGNSINGCYIAEFKVYDSQLPYPAVGLAAMNNLADVLLNPCSQANQAQGIGVNPDTFLQGPMAILLRGFDANGPIVIAGSVVFDGQVGNITGGTLDVTRSTGHQQLNVQKNGSSYVVGNLSFSEGAAPGPANVFDYSRGCMTLALADATNGTAAAPASFSFTLGGCTNHFTQNQLTSTSQVGCNFNNGQPLGTYTTGRIIEFDDQTGKGTRATGLMRQQSTSSFSGGLSGPYAFGMSGGNTAKQHYAIAGFFQAASGNLTAVAADFDDGGTLGTQLTGGAGTYSSADTNGRVTGSVSVGSASLDVAGYIIGPNEVLLATTDAFSAGHPIIGGEAITTASSFGQASLENTHMFFIEGLAPAGPDVSVGVLSFDGVGSVGGTVFEDQAATLATTAVSANYLVDTSTGRTSITTPTAGQTIGAHPFVAYLIPPPGNLTRTNCTTPASCVTGFLVGTDSTAQSGLLEFQTSVTPPPPPFNNLFVAGNYAFGTAESTDALTPNIEGDVFATPSANSTTNGNMGSGAGNPPFLQDADYGDTNYFCLPSSNCYLLQPNQMLSGSYSVATNGTGNFGGGTVSVTNGNVVFFIDESPTNKHPAVSVAEQ